MVLSGDTEATPEASMTSDVDIINVVNNNVATDEAILTASNEADLTNDLVLLVATDEAQVNANISNLVNTNIVGSNWSFNVVNLFQPQDDDIILPYEFDYLTPANELSSSNNYYNVDNFNQADVSSNIVVEGSTDNTTINILDVVNTNIVGNQWLFLQINNLGQWDGQLEGWWGNYYQDDHHFFAWANLDNDNDYRENATIITVKNSNIARVENNIHISSNNNQAVIKANIFDFVNTNIVGDNWYYSMINIFDNFAGNIIFPRPDLLVSLTANKNEILPGEEVTYHLHYENQGNLSASGSSLTAGQKSWQLGEVKPGEAGDIYFTFRVNSDYPADKITTTALISTTTFELNKDNNSSVNTVLIKKESNKTAIEEKIEETPTPTPTIIINPPLWDQVMVLGNSEIKTPQKKIAQKNPKKEIDYLSYLILFPGVFFLVLGFLVRRNQGDRWWT